MKSEPDSQRLRQVVAAYGADPRRWPDGERQGLADAARAEADSDWMAQARGLDRVLDQGRDGAFPTKLDTELVSAILAKAAATPQIEPQGGRNGGRVVELLVPKAINERRMPGRSGGALGHLPEAAILAASLLIGIWAGGNDVFDSELFEIGIVASFTGSTEDEINFVNALIGIDLTDNEGML
ncbi:hypothetical protein MNBD_ALPHA09-1032 [hydrothermal vent metagenome]|uniref:Uncharacterized protein n=1 Tax=hydrothermal vent metagenome TaxID=652676 RepID=A0A3B0TFQ5_9ZZZZ